MLYSDFLHWAAELEGWSVKWMEIILVVRLTMSVECPGDVLHNLHLSPCVCLGAGHQAPAAQKEAAAGPAGPGLRGGRQ